MEKLATYIVREGALDPSDSVGWAVRLTIALEVLHGAGVSHGRISARAIQVLADTGQVEPETQLIDLSEKSVLKKPD